MRILKTKKICDQQLTKHEIKDDVTFEPNYCKEPEFDLCRGKLDEQHNIDISNI